MIQEIIITVGLPSSGKTTWAEEYQKEHPNTQIVCKDDIRKELFGHNHAHRDEGKVLQYRDILISEALEKGQNVIVADTNLNPVHIGTILKKYKRHPTIKVRIKSFLDIDKEECIKRDALRPDGVRVGADVINRMYDTYLKSVDEERDNIQKRQNKAMLRCVIVDIDGTLAIHNGRSPFDYEKCDTDLPREDLIKELSVLQNNGAYIFVVSGRPDDYRKKTEEWLDKHNILFNRLSMRKSGDFRDDTIVKKEILYDMSILDSHKIIKVFDDRPRVIRMWKSLGFNVQEYGPGYEF